MDEDLVVVTVQGLFQEENVRAFLAAYGIPSRVRTHAVQGVHAITIDGIGAVAILVPAERAGEARDLLAQVQRGELTLPADEDPEEAPPEGSTE